LSELCHYVVHKPKQGAAYNVFPCLEVFSSSCKRIFKFMSKNFSYSFRRLVGAIINVLKVNDCQAIFRYFDFFFAAFRL